jgi:predicted permease
MPAAVWARLHTPMLKQAFRQILQRPGFSLTVACSLALGIGLVTTQFSLIDGILLRGLPSPDAQRIMHVSRLDPQNPNGGFWDVVSFRDYLYFREHQTSLESLPAMMWLGLNLSGAGRLPSHHPGALVTANTLEMLGAQPMLGRWFTEAEDRPGQPLMIVLSHRLWMDEFAGDAQVIGRPLTINGESGTIIGVMPPKFAFPGSERLWINLRATVEDPRKQLVDRVQMFGRLRRDVSLESARAEFNRLGAELEKIYPETNHGMSRMLVQKFTTAMSGGGTRSILLLMLTMTGFILVLACVNVANMLLGRAAQRTRELAVRAAVGATRGRLIRQLLGEAFVLTGLGAVGGFIVALFGVDFLQKYIAQGPYMPGWFDFRLDYRVGLAAIGITLVAGLIAGILPALKASRLDVNTALKDDARAASGLGLGRLARWFVTTQIAVSSALLVAACVLAWTIYTVRQANLRHDPEHLLTGRIEVFDSVYPKFENRTRFYRELLTRLENEPGVEAVAVTSRNFIGNGVLTQIAPEGVVFAHDNDRPQVNLEVVSDGYFRLVGVKPIAGRFFDTREQQPHPGERSAVVNELFARKFWPGQDPIGRRFRTNQTGDDWVVVIGVVTDLKMAGLFAPPGLESAGFYLCQDQMAWGWLDLFVRTKGDPLKLVTPVRAAIAAIDPNQPIDSVGTLQSATALAIYGFSIIGIMAAIFAFITLGLGAVGVYGVTSLAVNRRRREFGVRMALGATVGQVLRLVLAQGGRQIVVGLAVGLAAGFALTRPLGNIFGASVANHPAIYAVVAAVIALVGIVALWLPARRASRVDPMVALRAE